MSYLCLETVHQIRFILLFGKLEVPSKWPCDCVIIIFDLCVVLYGLMLLQHEPVFDTAFYFFFDSYVVVYRLIFIQHEPVFDTVF